METVPYTDLCVGQLFCKPYSKPFLDARYTFMDIGNYSNDCTFIRGSNADKNTDKSAIQTILQVPFASTVYLDFWGWTCSSRKGVKLDR